MNPPLIPSPSGEDPRRLADYADLRQETAKLSRPRGPDADHAHISALCQRLLALGIPDLEVTAWYTLARTHLTGPAGLNEGLILLKVLLACQWDTCHPALPEEKRAVLASLAARLQCCLNAGVPALRDRPLLLRAGQHAETLDRLVRRRMPSRSPSQPEPFTSLRDTLRRLSGAPPCTILDTPQPVPLTGRAAALRVRPALAGRLVMMALTGALALWGLSLLPGAPRRPADVAGFMAPLAPDPAWPDGDDDWMRQVHAGTAGPRSLTPQGAASRTADDWPVEVLRPDSPDAVVAGWQQGLAPLQALAARLDAAAAEPGRVPSPDEMKQPVAAALRSLYRASPPEIRPRPRDPSVTPHAVSAMEPPGRAPRRTAGGR